MDIGFQIASYSLCRHWASLNSDKSIMGSRYLHRYKYKRTGNQSSLTCAILELEHLCRSSCLSSTTSSWWVTGESNSLYIQVLWMAFIRKTSCQIQQKIGLFIYLSVCLFVQMFVLFVHTANLRAFKSDIMFIRGLFVTFVTFDVSFFGI